MEEMEGDWEPAPNLDKKLISGQSPQLDLSDFYLLGVGVNC